MLHHEDSLNYLDQPSLVRSLKLNFKQQTVDVAKAIPKGCKAAEAHFQILAQTGGGNKDEVFTLCFRPKGKQCRQWMMGHAYSQNAWSYNSANFMLPIADVNELQVTLDKPQPGHSKLDIFLVAFR